jgi:hypothetical protein
MINVSLNRKERKVPRNFVPQREGAECARNQLECLCDLCVDYPAAGWLSDLYGYNLYL